MDISNPFTASIRQNSTTWNTAVLTDMPKWRTRSYQYKSTKSVFIYL